MYILTALMLNNLLSVVQSGWIHLYVEQDNKCPGAQINDGHLPVTSYEVIAVDKETRETDHIFHSTECGGHKHNYGKEPMQWTYDFNRKRSDYKTHDVVIGITVIRKKGRANENPSVTAFSQNETKCFDGLEKPGTHSDFSSMYLEAPFRPGPMRVELLDEKGKRVHTWFEYTPPRECYATDSWIANEGHYLLDTETSTWYPIYFDIDEFPFIF
ncbi:unnamed protein product [Cylicocyclus nassatus]|uniref:Secreted protein n=1 Tax=Cylicocyclus nassatus TaxID=53992 RepID=A0AA36MAF0_CYLNA|nr:unnamed protein product [Cylicocyclus nassatus]